MALAAAKKQVLSARAALEQVGELEGAETLIAYAATNALLALAEIAVMWASPTLYVSPDNREEV